MFLARGTGVEVNVTREEERMSIDGEEKEI